MDSFEALYQKHRDEVFRYLLWLVNDTQLAEDFTQDTFLNAYASFSSFRGDSSVRTWMFSIARHQWLHYLRSKKKTEEWSFPLQELPSGTLEDAADARELLELIRRLLAEKDETTRMVVTKRLSGYSYAEICSTLPISEASARVLDFRCKKWLKERLKKEGYHEDDL